MAIVNNLGGGQMINTVAPTQQVTNQLMQGQQLSQQALQERQRQMQNYLEQLPTIGAQLGYSPEQMGAFLESQAPGIRQALGVLGVRDIDQTVQGMTQAMTGGQIRARTGMEFGQAKRDELVQEADRRAEAGDFEKRF